MEPLRDSGAADPPQEMDQLSPTGEKLFEMDMPRDSEHEEDEDDLDGVFTVEEEKTVLAKLDKRVVGLVAFLYLLSFLDRSNIGNARIAGLMEDLRMDDDQYEWLLTGFYITYITFEWMTLLFRLIPPHIYLAVVVLSWGIIASLQAATTSYGALLLLRIMLGLAEAAFCGVPFYLSFFFRREELAFRTGLFISAAPLATSCASSLAWLITALAQPAGGIAPWRLLFLVEGFPSVLVAWYCYRHVADGPGSAWFLTKRERMLAVHRLRGNTSKEAAEEERENQRDGISGRHAIKMSEIVETLKDPKSYLTAAMYFSCNVAFSSMPVFLPTIIQEMGNSSLMSQALSAPPYLVSFVVVLYTAYISDRRASRSPYIIFFAILASCGYSLIVLSGALGMPSWIRYLGLYPACVGFFTCITLILTWTLNNQDSETKKGAGIAMLQFLGQCGPLVGTRLFPDDDGPLYARGMAACAVCMAAVACLAVGLRWVLRRENLARLKTHLADGGGAAKAAAAADADVEQPLVGDAAEKVNSKAVFLFML